MMFRQIKARQSQNVPEVEWQPAADKRNHQICDENCHFSSWRHSFQLRDLLLSVFFFAHLLQNSSHVFCLRVGLVKLFLRGGHDWNDVGVAKDDDREWNHEANSCDDEHVVSELLQGVENSVDYRKTFDPLLKQWLSTAPWSPSAWNRLKGWEWWCPLTTKNVELSPFWTIIIFLRSVFYQYKNDEHRQNQRFR